MKEEMASAGNFWNISKSNTKETTDFFATRDVTKTPLNEISFANSASVKPDIIPAITTAPPEKQENEEKEKSAEEVKDEEYCLELVSLNKSVLDWIKQHVTKNPCIDLTPVIRDYEKHLTTIGEKYKCRLQTNQSTTMFKTPEPTHPSPVSSISGKKDMVSFISSTPISSCGAQNTVKFPPAGFFAPSVQTIVEKPEEVSQNAKPTENDSAPDDAPPVVERKVIVEEDAFHQIRSKLFFKKGGSWQELGVGMLYLKPCGEKIQLLIRMESVTGKVLLNINVSTDVPISRSGKNNLIIVSVPNPPVYAKPADGDNSIPCTYLLRVKGTTEADDLFAKLRPST